MESLADATKGKVKAADGEAEKKKKKEKEDAQQQPYTRAEGLRQRLQHRTSLAGPARLRPNALARLQQSACAQVAEGRPAWALAAARLRAVAEGHQGHGAAGMPRPHAGGRILADCDRCNVVSGRFKMVAWPRAGLLCKEGQTEHGVEISAWSTVASVSFDSTY